MAFVPEQAPLVLLLLLATGLVVIVGAALAALSLALRTPFRARWIVLGAGVWCAGYFAVLIWASLASREHVLARNELKYFCEVDCHEAYAVVDVATAPALGAGPGQVAARGTFYLVTLKVWFDERTISSRRPKALPLGPNPRAAQVVDESGKRYGISIAGQQALEQGQGKQEPLNRPLQPGESYTTTLVFDLPLGAINPRLLVANDEWPTRFLIGHENSFFHKKVMFRLGLSREGSAAGPGS